MPPWLELVAFIIALMCTALFSYLETIFTALRLFEVNQLEARIGRYRKLFALWRSSPQNLLITILIASNFADVISSVLVTELMQKFFGGELGLAVGVFCATLLMLIFGTILPKTFARTGGANMGIKTIGFVNALVTVLSPVVRAFSWVTDKVVYRGNGGAPAEVPVTEQEIEFLIDYSDQQGIMESDKSEMLQKVFGLGQTCVNAIMVPKNEMVTLNVETSLDQAYEMLSSRRFSRIPLFEGSPENIIGFLHQKDLFILMHKQQAASLRECMRPLLFVPESKRVNQLLREFLLTHRHLAIVIDEYGSVIGLVTLEDVIEEIVGEIRDEHEAAREHEMMPLEGGEYLIDGHTELRKVEDLLRITIRAEESITLAGFLAEKLQRIPRIGDRVTYMGYCFQVQQAKQRTVQQVLVFAEPAE